ncbi:MAG: hypothetical protein ACREDH_13190 [Methylocella sp.]
MLRLCFSPGTRPESPDTTGSARPEWRRGSETAGLIGSEGFAIDASVIEADASRNHRIEGATA